MVTAIQVDQAAPLVVRDRLQRPLRDLLISLTDRVAVEFHTDFRQSGDVAHRRLEDHTGGERIVIHRQPGDHGSDRELGN